jgi:hypothetical protein
VINLIDLNALENALIFLSVGDIVIQVDSEEDKKIARDYITKVYTDYILYDKLVEIPNVAKIYFEVIDGDKAGEGWEKENIPIFYIGNRN